MSLSLLNRKASFRLGAVWPFRILNKAVIYFIILRINLTDEPTDSPHRKFVIEVLGKCLR